MKFINKNGNELEFLKRFNQINSSISPIKELFGKNELTDWSIKLDEEEIGFDNIFTLKVNVKKVGSVLCLFKKDNFNKEEVVNEVINLKEIKVKDLETSKSKVKSLLEIVEKREPLLTLYRPSGDYQLDEETYQQLGYSICLYVIPSNSVEEQDDSKKIKLDNPFKVLAKDKYHFVFGIVAAFLIGFTISIAIFDMYLGKLIYIFFLICTLAGMTLNGFIYHDSIKRNKLLSTHFILTVAASLVGYALSIGGYILFKSLAKEKPTTDPKLLLILGAGIALIAISACVAFLVKFIKDKKRAKK